MQRWHPPGCKEGTKQPSFIDILCVALPSCSVKVCACLSEGADRVMDDTVSDKRDSTAGLPNDRGSGPARARTLRRKRRGAAAMLDGQMFSTEDSCTTGTLSFSPLSN
uniref:Uncharacterized protein n=1 Tax=Knipowitschia caucasica TaxID=637954 RepID=A0AAV2LKQ1_KNICA